MRMIVGALLGLVLGTAVVAIFGIAIDRYAYLAALVAGLVAGVAMRSVVGPGGSIYAKGALAAIATVAATILGPMAEASWFRAQADAKTLNGAKVVVAESLEEESDVEVGEAVVIETEEAPALSEAGLKAPLRAPANNPFAAADVACLVIGCLAAYQIGKGEVPTVAEEEADAEAPSDAAAPPPAE